ncbi:TPA: hypothetical protein QCP61_004881 [Bacillus cereus]|uniref:hypothetical protein n=1 Tax=Bacillus sp. HBCD-sjtu TaxID=2053832 RepID=UPI000C343462|nr:hypothetical protein [Bacillus sp. HBCD-sjtu]AUD24118.1 hypothetical protein CU648_17345 [Bacillus sp. HBCD-sjtu]HDR4392748.1 hypothetical protein [Bacillus cereus]
MEKLNALIKNEMDKIKESEQKIKTLQNVIEMKKVHEKQSEIYKTLSETETSMFWHIHSLISVIESEEVIDDVKINQYIEITKHANQIIANGGYHHLVFEYGTILVETPCGSGFLHHYIGFENGKLYLSNVENEIDSIETIFNTIHKDVQEDERIREEWLKESSTPTLDGIFN